MKTWLACIVCLLVLVPCPVFAAEMDALSEDATPAATTGTEIRKPVRISDSSILPLRVLTRSMSSLYTVADETSAVVRGNLPAFLPYYVYTRPGGEDRALEQGWYEVGTDNRGTIVGWLKTADVFEWKQTMCLTYAHPEMRHPVLMFDAEQSLTELIAQEASAREAVVDGLYTTIESGTIPEDFSVVSIEPKQAVDFTKQFYLLPILDHKTVTVDGREGRLLQLAAVSGAAPDARESTDIRENADYAKAAAASSADAAGSVAATLGFDIVWVIDTTRSMRPYIDATRDVVLGVSKTLAADEAVSAKLRFGVWAFRDPVEAIPDIEYTTKNFTPDLQDVQTFAATMGTVKETTVDSVDFPEDVFSGLADAIEKTNWTPGAVRIIVLVGDAPGHELGNKFNVSGLDDVTTRALATTNNVTLLAIQVRPRGAVSFQKTAETQFRALSLGAGMDTPAYYSIDGRDMASFSGVSATIAVSLQNLVDTASQGRLAEALADDASLIAEPGGELAALADMGEPTAEAQAAVAEGNAGLDQAMKAALVQWIGSESGAKPPRDIVAWVTDKDLLDTAKQSLEVRLLINKRQLDSLATLLGDIIAAGRRGQISGDDFFTSLQAASAVASRDPDMLRNAQSLGQSGLVPDFLADLPYHSRLMDMSNELWGAWSPDEQDNFLNELDARMNAYRALHDNPQGWVTLNEGEDADESVYPIPLDLLP